MVWSIHGCAVTGLAVAVMGCAGAVRPANPRIPGATVRFVERDAPFVVDWEPQQIANLSGALRDRAGAVVVSFRRNAIRLLPDCGLSGAYAGFGVGMYTGTLQIRSSESAGMMVGLRADALQQISTSAHVGQGTLLDYRFVLVGRYDISGSRRTAGLLELQDRAPDACRGASHFVRAVYTGAFERMSDAYGAAGAQAAAFGVGAGASAQSQQTITAKGGDVEKCAQSGRLSSPSCSALLKIELAPLQPAVVALRLTAYQIAGQIAPNLRFRFRGKNGYQFETPSFMSAAAQATAQLATAEITDDAPLQVEALQQTEHGTSLVGSGQVTPAHLRQRSVPVELRGPPTGSAVGTVWLAW